MSGLIRLSSRIFISASIGVLFGCTGTSSSGQERTTIGLYSHETEDVLSVICYYDTAYGLKALNVDYSELCPMTYRFPI